MKLAIIGCGAVAARGHLPAAARLDDAEIALLIDKDEARARGLAEQFGVEGVAARYQDAIGVVEAAVVALPHHLHAPVCCDLLAAGVHVLVEKPMAISASGCHAMMEAAERGGATLAVGMMRRFLPNAVFARTALEQDLLGPITRFDFREGNVFNWPVASDYLFRREFSGGGVLFDTGAHTLDLLLWWLGEVDLLDYRDDDCGGVEADCQIRLRTRAGAEGFVELSRTRALRNTAIIAGERGVLEVDLRKNHATLRLDSETGGIALAGLGETAGAHLVPQAFADLFYPQLKDFVGAAKAGRTPKCSAAEAAQSVALIESCYAVRSALDSTWAPVSAGSAPRRFAGKTVLVTGATGFLGGGLVERLALEEGARVRALVRNFSRAARLARLPVELVSGDILDEEAVARALEGSDYVFHCAYDFAGDATRKEAVSVEGTDNVCRAAIRCGVNRLIHLSTFSVYAELAGRLDESAAKRPDGDVYSTTKLNAEAVVLKYYRESDLQAVLLQPTIVYGPFSRPWTIGPLSQLSSGLVPLPKAGAGLCNAVYVDDVVEAMLLAAFAPEAVGQSFLISGEEPVTWAGFYKAYESILGRAATIFPDDDSFAKALPGAAAPAAPVRRIIPAFVAKAASKVDPSLKNRFASASAVRPFSRWLREKRPEAYDRLYRIMIGPKVEKTQPAPDPVKIHWPDATRLALLSSTAKVSIDKAKRVLSYAPRVDFDEGMRRSAAFARWANLV